MKCSLMSLTPGHTGHRSRFIYSFISSNGFEIGEIKKRERKFSTKFGPQLNTKQPATNDIFLE